MPLLLASQFTAPDASRCALATLSVPSHCWCSPHLSGLAARRRQGASCSGSTSYFNSFSPTCHQLSLSHDCCGMRRPLAGLGQHSCRLRGARRQARMSRQGERWRHAAGAAAASFLNALSPASALHHLGITAAHAAPSGSSSGPQLCLLAAPSAGSPTRTIAAQRAPAASKQPEK